MYERNETETLMQRIGQVRRSTGLSHADFAKSLNVPAWQTIIAECGVHFCDGQGRMTIVEPLFNRNEFTILLQNISRVYGVPMDWLLHGMGKVSLRETALPDDELTLYFPVVISCQSFLDDLKKLVDLLQLHRLAESERKAVEKDSLAFLLLKYKAYHSYFAQMGKPEFALVARRQILDFCKQK